ncbi:MAG: erythromycin esterase family protein [Candidatus Woesearchaeota archaeon]
MRKIILTFLVNIIFILVLAGCTTLINEQTNNFYTEIINEDNYNELIERMKDKDLVLLGESTHGTQEYYEIRSLISKKLIEEHDFRFIAVEGDWKPIYKINLYVKGLSEYENANEILKTFDRWPEWMWANKVIEELAEWLKEYNQNLSEHEQVGIYGFDVYGAGKSLITVQEMSNLEYNCMSQFLTDFTEYARSLASNNDTCESEVIEIYESIIQDENIKERLNDKEYFYLKQNALIVKNAERHYRAMVYPWLSSWNERVFHMNQTITYLINEKQGKGILWAHNTHVGDSRATSMIDSGSVNMGQLLRETEKDIFILGFGTYTGKVLAGRQWGDNMQILNIPNAGSPSYEAIMNNHGINKGIIFMNNEDLPQDIIDINYNRAIGVVYNPEHEFPGNYVRTNITARYDAFIFINQTNELQVI